MQPSGEREEGGSDLRLYGRIFPKILRPMVPDGLARRTAGYSHTKKLAWRGGGVGAITGIEFRVVAELRDAAIQANLMLLFSKLIKALVEEYTVLFT